MSLQRKKQKQPDVEVAHGLAPMDPEQREQLASIGMSIRKSISDGHKTSGGHNASLYHESRAPTTVHNPLRGSYGPALDSVYGTKSFSAAAPSALLANDKPESHPSYRGVGAQTYSTARSFSSNEPSKKRGREESELADDEDDTGEDTDDDSQGMPVIKLQPRESFQD